jgi:hypothetical protein
VIAFRQIEVALPMMNTQHTVCGMSEVQLNRSSSNRKVPRRADQGSEKSDAVRSRVGGGLANYLG